jgi:hypothetical protein
VAEELQQETEDVMGESVFNPDKGEGTFKTQSIFQPSSEYRPTAPVSYQRQQTDLLSSSSTVRQHEPQSPSYDYDRDAVFRAPICTPNASALHTGLSPAVEKLLSHETKKRSIDETGIPQTIIV